MADITIYQKPTCSTCKEVYQILKESNAEMEAVDYFTDPIPKAKLRELIQKIGLPVEELIRKKDQLFQDLRLGEKKLTEGQWLDLLAIYPDLLQRPIVEKGDKAIVARPARKIREFLASFAPAALPTETSESNSARNAQSATEEPNVVR
ncbi:MAG: arsenate reductase [Candidatus Omnitrophica bacterium]|nr:arsenate reductase [Candidatus Omnitrophota bacterium]